ncbi:hypothetical protein N7532_005867 [Penicillium argentinense]|uniref:DNA polymerase lambda n=1 Tax=Penicillium argentinense TaxID=1131581 RepID=A0A9W9KAU2_9EURO|nr:uncharacterized protein N7532_005867 [Penicillium argentinense]KAJ5098866.1 hypothetical protein N7532_005867 [Penicillium argentinense]
MGRSRSTSKASFFAALEHLDNPDDSQNEEDAEFEQILTVSRPSTHISNQTVFPGPSRPEPGTPLPRANTDPQTLSSNKAPGEQRNSHLNRQRRLSNEPQVLPIKRSHTTGTMPGTAGRCPAAKKRKIDAINAIPEAQQVFKDLMFFFVPNDDIAPARRLRIQRAREYGAQWTRQWGSHITHVIVEKGLQYQHLIDYLKLRSFPDDIALVNESYPSECIRFRSLLSPLQARFRVNGTPVPTIIEPTPVVEQKTTDPLPLKPSRQDHQKSPETSQGQNEESAPVEIAISEAVTSEAVQNTDVGADTGIVEPRERDALDDVIDESKAARHLVSVIACLSSKLEEGTDIYTSHSIRQTKTLRPSLMMGPTRRSPARQKKKARLVLSEKPKAAESWTRSFACMQKIEARRDNPNARTIEVLQEMLEYYTKTADHWRDFAYRRAINALRNQAKKIMTRGEALAISGIGSRLADKIEEIVVTNHLRRLDYTNSSPEDRVIQLFLGVYGAGLAQATQWVAQGYRSLDDLRDKATLKPNQRIGVERYHDFAQRIPRKEVEAHGAIVRRVVQAADKDMQAIIVGSYRRGAKDSGDIDVLITKPGAPLEPIRSLVMNVVVPQLFEEGFLKAGLATPRHNKDGSKWHGASSLPGIDLWRRIDLLFVPGPEIGAALLYFTGNDIFNRSMRLLARKKKMCLNQRGLFTDVLRNGQVKTNPGRLLEAGDERRIFELLGVPWRRSEERTC